MKQDATFPYKEADIIMFNNEKLTVANIEKNSNSKQVLKVYSGKIGDNNFKILKITEKSDKETKNTLKLNATEFREFMIELEDRQIIDDKEYLLFKYYKNGSLAQYLRKNSLNQEQKKKIIEQILKAGCWLHKNLYIHADIKLDNFFVDDDGSKVYLGDFEHLSKLSYLTQSLDYVAGTKGYKYSQGKYYDIWDELFSLVATIYFIETNSFLIDDKDIIDEENPIESINKIAKTKIFALQNSRCKQFLLAMLKDIENHKKDTTACKFLQYYQTYCIKEKETLKKEKIKDIGKVSNDSKQKEKKFLDKKYILPLLGAIVAIIAIFIFTNKSNPTNESKIESTITHHQREEKPQTPIATPTPQTTQESVVENNTTPTIAQPSKITSPQIDKANQIANTLRKLTITDKKLVEVNFQKNIKLGNPIKFTITPKQKGYLQLILIKPNGNKLIAYKSPIKLSKPKTISFPPKQKGEYYIGVIFTTTFIDINIHNFIEQLINLQKQSYGEEYFNIFGIDVE